MLFENKGDSPLGDLLQGPTAAKDEVVPKELQLLPALVDALHVVHVVIEGLIHQLQVNQGLIANLVQELESLATNLRDMVG